MEIRLEDGKMKVRSVYAMLVVAKVDDNHAPSRRAREEIKEKRWLLLDGALQ